MRNATKEKRLALNTCKRAPTKENPIRDFDPPLIEKYSLLKDQFGKLLLVHNNVDSSDSSIDESRKITSIARTSFCKPVVRSSGDSTAGPDRYFSQNYMSATGSS